MTSRFLTVTPAAALMALGLAWAPAGAGDFSVDKVADPATPPAGVIIQTPPAPPAPGVVVQPAPAPSAPGVVVQPPPATAAPAPPPAVTVITPSAVPATLQADDIKAHEVRAQAIYANKIEADNVQGVIHQSGGIKIKNSRGDIDAPQVAANTIFADTIKANSVIADHIYVRDIERK